MPDGRFVVLEGLDGAGITTQVEKLRTRYESVSLPISVTKEPSDGPVGILIKAALKRRLHNLSPEALALLFAADRHDHVINDIMPALDKGRIVLSDRYYLSSFAYQMVEVNDLDWLRSINMFSPRPDLTVYIDVPAEVCHQRMKSDVWRGGDQLQLYEEVSRLTQVRSNFQRVIEVLRSEGQTIVVVDGTKDMGAVADEILEAVRRLVPLPDEGDGRNQANSASQHIAGILEDHSFRDRGARPRWTEA